MSTYFVKFSLSLSIHLSIPIYILIDLFFYLYILLSIYSSINIFIIYIYSSIYSFIHLSMLYASIYLSIYLPNYLSVYGSIDQNITQGLILFINFSNWLPSYNELLLATHHPERHSTQVNSHSKKCSSHILIVHYSFVIVKRVLLFFSTKGIYTFVNTKCSY